MLYPLSYEGGARLDLRRNRTRLPILTGGWPVLLAGLDLNGTDTDTGRMPGAVPTPRDPKPLPSVFDEAGRVAAQACPTHDNQRNVG